MEQAPAVVEATTIDEKSKALIWDFMSFLVSHPKPTCFGREYANADIEGLSEMVEERFQEWVEAHEGALSSLKENPHQRGLDVFIEANCNVYRKHK